MFGVLWFSLKHDKSFSPQEAVGDFRRATVRCKARFKMVTKTVAIDNSFHKINTYNLKANDHASTINNNNNNNNNNRSSSFSRQQNGCHPSQAEIGRALILTINCSTVYCYRLHLWLERLPAKCSSAESVQPSNFYELY